MESGTLIFPAGEHFAEPIVVETGSREVHFELAADACLHLSAFVFAPAGSASLSLTVDLAGEHSEIHLHGLYIASGSGSTAIDVWVNHLVPDCRSRQTVNGIVAGEATGSFAGQVYVARDAQRTDASQQNRNLQLTDETRPQLEIYADDVKCAHGATIGRLDEEAVYYMRQRGISEGEARRMQLHGFAESIINHCPSEDSREIITAKADRLINSF